MMDSASKQEGQGRRPPADAIQRAKSELEFMIDLNPESMVLVDHSGIVVRANRAFLNLLRRKQFSDVLGQPLAELFSLDRELLDGLLGDRGTFASREVAVELRGAGRRQLRFSLVNGHGAETRILLLHDMTDELAAAANLEKANKLDAVQALMGALMHHLNQPLTVVMIRAKLMHQSLERGKASNEDLLAGMRDIMDLTMKMAGLLRKVEESNAFETQEYVKGLDILKIDAD